MEELDQLSWPLSRVGEALEALVRKSGLAPQASEAPRPPEGLAQDDGETLGRWIQAAAVCLGLEAEAVEVPTSEFEQTVSRAGPALLGLPRKGEARFWAVLSGRRQTISLLGPDLMVHRLRPQVVYDALCQEFEAPLVAEINQLFGEAGISRRRQARARAVIVRERLGPARIGTFWLLRLPPGANLWRQARYLHLPRRLLGLVGAYAVQSFLSLLSWWMIGQGALQGRLDQGWLFAWALLLLTLVPLRVLTTWSQGVLAISMGGLFKQRLLYGALRLGPEEIRHMGAGQLLGRVIESEAVESLALSGGFLGLVAPVELVIALVVLKAGAGGWLHVFLFLAWAAVPLCIGLQFFRHRRRWTQARLTITHDLVERMVGYRTRLAQEPREHWHDGEDQALESYLELSRAMDRIVFWQTLVPRGWLVLGLLGLARAFIYGPVAPGAIAVGLGGMFLASQALSKLTAGLAYLVDATIAWQQVAPFFHAATRPEVEGLPAFSALDPRSARSEDGQSILAAHDLVFNYREQGDPVLRGCDLQIYAGNRILIEGPSGGGKSTLVSLLIGLRHPQSGLLLLRGLDRQTLGTEGWRRRVVAAPQFHENHVLTGTFAFNLLMGRRWPPQPDDMREADAICRELGLGELLDRMPAKMLQMVGETGWQLSHGERSRLYIARALLHDADLVVLDESFAALDPETLRQCLRCVLARATTLLVIAHP